jgi:hypothetical protein
MKNEKTANKKPKDPTTASLENGKKSIETEMKTRGKSKEDAGKDNKKDAEKWRNEG